MTAAPSASPSIILRATHILLVRVDACTATAWQTSPNQWLQRSLDLRLRLLDVLKGGAQPLSEVAVRIAQYANPGLVHQPIPGVWSAAQVDRGVELVIFAAAETAASADVARLLTEPACIAVAPAASALAGVRLALSKERGQISMPQLLSEADAAAAGLDLIFIEYLITLLHHPEIAKPDAFAHLMALLENPRLTAQSKMALLMETQYALSVAPAFGPAHRERFVITLFRVALASTEPGMRQQIFTATLPTVIGLSDIGATLAAHQVFRDKPQDRARILESLRPFTSEAPAARLAAWLQR